MSETNIMFNTYSTFLGELGYKYVDLLWYISSEIKPNKSNLIKMLEMYAFWKKYYMGDIKKPQIDDGSTYVTSDVQDMSDIYWSHMGLLRVLETINVTKNDHYKHVIELCKSIIDFTIVEDLNDEKISKLNFLIESVSEYISNPELIKIQDMIELNGK